MSSPASSVEVVTVERSSKASSGASAIFEEQLQKIDWSQRRKLQQRGPCADTSGNAPADVFLDANGVPQKANPPNQTHNPDLNAVCGDLKILLILDASFSINLGDESKQVVDSAKAVINVLTGTGTKLGIIEFGTFAGNAKFTDGAGMDTDFVVLDDNGAQQALAYVANYKNNTRGPRNIDPGFTNWDEALNLANRLQDPKDIIDLCIFVTDGNPTAYDRDYADDEDIGIETGFIEVSGLHRAIEEANCLKNEGTHILSLGVLGDDLTVDNLKLISDFAANDTTSFVTATSGTFSVQTTDVLVTETLDALEEALLELVFDLCSPTLTITAETFDGIRVANLPCSTSLNPNNDFRWILPAGNSGNGPNAGVTDQGGSLTFNWQDRGPISRVATVTESGPDFDIASVDCQVETLVNGVLESTSFKPDFTDSFEVNMPANSIGRCLLINQGPGGPPTSTLNIRTVTYDNEDVPNVPITSQLTPSTDFIWTEPAGAAGPSAVDTTDSNGSVTFQWEDQTQVGISRTVAVDESSGDFIIDSVQCTIQSQGGAAGAISVVTLDSFNIVVPPSSTVDCVLKNRPPARSTLIIQVETYDDNRVGGVPCTASIAPQGGFEWLQPDTTGAQATDSTANDGVVTFEWEDDDPVGQTRLVSVMEDSNDYVIASVSCTVATTNSQGGPSGIVQNSVTLDAFQVNVPANSVATCILRNSPPLSSTLNIETVSFNNNDPVPDVDVSATLSPTTGFDWINPPQATGSSAEGTTNTGGITSFQWQDNESGRTVSVEELSDDFVISSITCTVQVVNGQGQPQANLASETQSSFDIDVPQGSIVSCVLVNSPSTLIIVTETFEGSVVQNVPVSITPLDEAVNTGPTGSVSVDLQGPESVTVTESSDDFIIDSVVCTAQTGQGAAVEIGGVSFTESSLDVDVPINSVVRCVLRNIPSPSTLIIITESSTSTRVPNVPIIVAPINPGTQTDSNGMVSLDVPGDQSVTVTEGSPDYVIDSVTCVIVASGSEISTDPTLSILQDSFDITIPVNSIVTCTLQDRPSSTLTVITEENGRPADGVTITVTPPGQSTVTGSNGSVTVDYQEETTVTVTEDTDEFITTGAVCVVVTTISGGQQVTTTVSISDPDDFDIVIPINSDVTCTLTGSVPDNQVTPPPVSQTMPPISMMSMSMSMSMGRSSGKGGKGGKGGKKGKLRGRNLLDMAHIANKRGYSAKKMQIGGRRVDVEKIHF